MTEYYLEKKTIGGWSRVTWYDSIQQAEENYARLIKDIGYSYRLVKVETVKEDMLDEVVEVEAPELEVKKTTWGAEIKAKPITNSWGGINTKSDKFWGDDVNGNHIEKEHGLSGSVWVINHSTKDKKRVSASELDAMLKNGYERGGPRTQFREG